MGDRVIAWSWNAVLILMIGTGVFAVLFLLFLAFIVSEYAFFSIIKGWFDTTGWAAFSALATAIAALSSLGTCFIALLALRSWKTQERERLTLLWKADILEYMYTLPYLKAHLTYPADSDMIGQIAGKFYNCIKSYMLMREYVPPKKFIFYQQWWDRLCNAHTDYCVHGKSKEMTSEVFASVYLQKFL